MYPLKPLSWYVEYYAKRSPKKICIGCEDKAYTYKEIDLIITIIAKKLRDNGLCHDSVIGIYAKRSELIPIFILSIIKAGAIFVPLHEDFPNERLNHIIKDSQIEGILTDNGDNTLAFIDNNIWTLAISIEGINVIINEHIDKHDDLPLTPISNRAAIYYTSGSSGRPKGAVHTHESIMTSNISECQTLNITANDSILLATHWTICFSITSFEAMIVGGALYIATDDMCMDLSLIHTYAEDNKISIIHMPTQIGFQYSQLFPRSGIRLLYVGGSPFQTLKNEVTYDIINVYGSTEGMALSFSKCAVGMDKASLGRPYSHTKWLVVDNHGKPVEKGIIGELWVSSKCLAIGYLNLHQISHSRFFLHNGAQTFATNDLVIENPDGSFTYIGRKDVMIKIRGLRIEPDEIAFNIIQHSCIKQACVCLKMINNIDYLCAYYVQEDNTTTVTDIDLSNYLRAFLSDSMIPTFFVKVDSLPLNNRGKINYDLLPEPIFSNLFQPNNDLSPVEKTLLKVISETINTTEIDINDNFFSIGGDSLSALLVVSKLRNHGYLLRVNMMKECKSIKEIASRITQNEHVGNIEKKNDIVDHSSLFQYVARNNSKKVINHFIIEDLIKSRYRINISKLHETIRLLVSYHEILNASYISNHLVFNTANSSFETIREFTIDDSKSNYSADFEKVLNMFYSSFDITHSLFKVILIHLIDYDVVVLGSHHMISDAISKRNIIRDFCSIYHDLLRNVESLAIDIIKPLPFRAYQDSIRDFYNTSISDKEKQYWDIVRNQLPKPILEKRQYANKCILITSDLEPIPKSKIMLQSIRYQKGLLSIVAAAVYNVITRIFHVKTIAVQVFLHGRNEQFIGSDNEIFNECPFLLGSSVGCFVVNPPIIISGNDSNNTFELLSNIDHLLVNMPNGGVGFDATGGYPKSLIPSFGIDMVGIRDTLYPKDIYSEDFERCKGLPHGQPMSDHLDMGCPYLIYVGISKEKLFLKVRYNQAYISDSLAKQVLDGIGIEIQQVIKLLEADL